jgi:hypothetical protein
MCPLRIAVVAEEIDRQRAAVTPLETVAQPVLAYWTEREKRIAATIARLRSRQGGATTHGGPQDHHGGKQEL